MCKTKGISINHKLQHSLGSAFASRLWVPLHRRRCQHAKAARATCLILLWSCLILFDGHCAWTEFTFSGDGCSGILGVKLVVIVTILRHDIPYHWARPKWHWCKRRRCQDAFINETLYHVVANMPFFCSLLLSSSSSPSSSSSSSLFPSSSSAAAATAAGQRGGSPTHHNTP